MKQHDRPPQLKSGDEASPELRDALRALGKQHTHPARLERTAEKLDRLFASAPVTSPVKLPWLLGAARNKTLITRLAIGLLAVGGGSAVWLVGSRPSEQGQLPPPAPAARRDAPHVDEPVAPSRELLRAQPSTVLVPTIASAGDASARPQVQETSGRSPKSTRNVTRPRTMVTPRPSTPPSPPFLDPSRTQQVPLESVARPVQATAPAGRPAPDRQLSEIELLFAARQQLRRDTKAGLRLLDEHRARFPDGQLAPEREVLAIEALRKLGQTDAAAKRFAAFRARHADSLHLQRLQHPE